MTIFLTIHVQETFAQTISYGYDAAGNRISRVITMPRSMAQKNKVEETNIQSEMLENLEIRLYPNPTDGILNVEVDRLPEGMQARFSIYNLSGKLLLDKNSPSGYETLDLTSQPAGTYILQITAGENKTEWKIIKK